MYPNCTVFFGEERSETRPENWQPSLSVTRTKRDYTYFILFSPFKENIKADKLN